MTQPFFNVRTVVGQAGVVAWIPKTSLREATSVVAWMVKNALGVILAKGGNPEKYSKVILNLFQDLLQEMLKQVQHDKEKPGFPFSRE
ncbi:hypothetical protein [Rickettsia endosymbiont of Orchestes rusci]|uniref:hypothetical protein n=1 Tax=Rickettsia endosymbiont of Orchestes rusci TaxID=3066250 RepID=UPI00313F3C0D